jgi:amino acid transporter
VANTWRNLKRILVGRPLSTDVAHAERIGRLPGLAVFSSDALSSVAYAVEEILIVLAPVGAVALAFSVPVAAAIVVVLFLVVMSYRQVIPAYPHGGGSYSVAKENLGTTPGLVAAASLLVDYTLTVAVSVAAGIAAVTSAVPVLYEHRVALAVLCVALVALANLRGVRESAAVLSVPTYGFILSLLGLLAVGAFRWATGTLPHAAYPEAVHAATTGAVAPALTLFLVLRAFSSGCTAMTGVEAIANGVTSFKEPAAKNAVATLTMLAAILSVLFVGTTALAHALGVVPVAGQTVISQIGRLVVGGGPFYFAVQIFTAMVLLLAANTCFAAFPTLSSILAADRFMPRQLAHRGDRLVYSNGVLILSFLACALIVVFRGDTHALIPLYAIGVFLSFTLSQLGMVRRALRLRDARWARTLLISGTGALATALVVGIFTATKFLQGAWMVVVVIPLLILFFLMLKDHYVQFGKALAMEEWSAVAPRRHTAIVPVSGIHRGVANALTYALSVSKDVRAVYITEHPQDGERMEEQWALWDNGVPLVVLESPYRSVVGPLLRYIDQVDEEFQDDVGALVTVVLPEIVPSKWWHHLLHNNTALLVKGALLFRRGKIVVSVPYHLE